MNAQDSKFPTDSSSQTPKGIESYLESFLSDEFFTFLETHIGLDLDNVKTFIPGILEEAAFGYKLISTLDLKGKRILEVGGGFGILSGYLALSGAEVTYMEPGDYDSWIGAKASEMRKNSQSPIIGQRILMDWLGLRDISFSREGIENIDPEKADKFDVIFSVNVLEHIDSPEEAFRNMSLLLRKDGVMLHTCPNYAVPYESHYSKILLPFWPRLTEHLLPKSITETSAWKSINFITYSDVLGYAKQNKLYAKFRKNMMWETLVRLETDKEFGGRHPAWFRITHKILKASRLLFLIKYVPVRFQTPLAFELYHKDH